VRWIPGRRSSNIEDRRGQRFRGGIGGLGLAGTVIAILLSLVFGQDFLSLLGGTSSTQYETAPGAPIETSAEEERMVDFVSFVLDSAQATWARILPGETGTPYRDAKLVLFRDAVQSACGSAQSASGPFYCPADEKVYVDLGFFDELGNRFGAPGDFAQAYVLAHEIGHHVQHLLGVDQRVRSASRDQSTARDLSVRMELQADCLAGAWGHHAGQANLLEPGDVQEGLGAAAAVGDDRLQRMGGGTISPETFTHGSSEQRMSWFQRGLRSGTVRECDTFSAPT
jgi:predicted metalloprotease